MIGKLLRVSKRRKKRIPFVKGSGAHCGFPSPAIDYVQTSIDLNDILIQHPSATILASVFGDSMRDAGIMDPAHLIIDRAEKLINNDIVVIVVDGDFQVRRYTKCARSGVVTFRSENKEKAHQWPPIVVGKEMADVDIWGIVTQILIDPRAVNGNSRI